MKNSFESNLIKIPANEVVDELYGKPPSKGEKDIAEFRKKKIKKPEGPKTPELFSNLIAREKESLKQFFGMEIEVPDLPEEITPEKLEFWENNKFALHYSPGIEIKEDDDFPGQKKKLGGNVYNVYRCIKEGKISPDTIKLPTGWILTDARPKPQYDEGNQLYENDILAPVLEKLRQDGQIEDFEHQGSRFNISHDELNKPEVKAALAEALNIEADQLGLPPAALWNYLGSAFCPEWGETDTAEWFKEEYQGGNRLFGGSSSDGGLSFVFCNPSGVRSDHLGFRPLINFSGK